MKSMFFLLLIIINLNAQAQDSLKNFNDQRNQVNKTGMEVLGSWGIANIGAGAAGWANSDGGSNKYFYQMNVIWGSVNLGAAILGFTGANRNNKKQFDVAKSLKEQRNLEKTFLVNGALDIAYIGTGIYLKKRGSNRDSNKLSGYGTSIILQGAFLFLFDGTMYTAQRSHGNKLRRFLEKNPVTFNGKNIGLIYHL